MLLSVPNVIEASGSLNEVSLITEAQQTTRLSIQPTYYAKSILA